MRAEGMDHNGAEKLLQQDHQYQAEDTEQTASRPAPGSLEPDPRLLHVPGDNKPHHLPGIAVSVVHHLLRIDEELSARRIIHRVRLERDIYEGQAAENKSGQKQPVLSMCSQPSRLPGAPPSSCVHWGRNTLSP